MEFESRDGRFERLLRDYGPALARLVAAYEPDRHEREDLLQDIALALWQALSAFRGECSERTFIFRVAHNRALTHRQQRRRAMTNELEEAASVVDPRVDLAGDVAASERRDHLMVAVRALPRALREVVVLRLEGLTNAEAGDVLGASENGVAIRLTRARKELARLLGAEMHV